MFIFTAWSDCSENSPKPSCVYIQVYPFFFHRILNNLADETLVSIHFRYVIIRSWFTRQSVGGANSPVGKKTEEEGATRWRQSKRKWWKMMQQTGCTVVQTFVISLMFATSEPFRKNSFYLPLLQLNNHPRKRGQRLKTARWWAEWMNSTDRTNCNHNQVKALFSNAAAEYCDYKWSAQSTKLSSCYHVLNRTEQVQATSWKWSLCC